MTAIDGAVRRRFSTVRDDAVVRPRYFKPCTNTGSARPPKRRLRAVFAAVYPFGIAENRAFVEHPPGALS